MGYYDAYDAILSVTSTNPRAKNIESTQKAIESTFYNHPSYYQVQVYLPSTPLSSTPVDAWIIDDSDTRDQKEIVVHPEQSLSRGSLVYWQNRFWIISQFDEDFGDIYDRGMLLKCIGSLKWLNSNGDSKETHFALTAPTGTNFGVQDGRIINLGNERRQIVIQKNNDTTLFRKDDRFIFDSRAWIITAIDGLHDGLVYLTLDEDTVNTATDDVENEIADESGTSAGGMW